MGEKAQCQVIELVLRSGKPNAERKGCVDCKFMRGAITLWCTNKAASDDRGTLIPGVIDCPHWGPCRTKNELGVIDLAAAALGLNIAYVNPVE